MSKEIVPTKKEIIKSKEKEMSFLDHLEELRWHIIRSIAAVFVLGIAFFLLRDLVFQIILAPSKAEFPTYRLLCNISEITCMKPTDFKLLPRDMGEQFFTHIKISIWLGFILAFPYVFWEFWRFIKPGLYKNEQKAARGIVGACSFLFMCGILFGYYVISPFAITFLTGYQVSPDIVSSPTLASYINYMTMLTIPTGIIFELPIVVYFLAKIGLISSDFMKKYRKHAFVIVFILAAIITPPDVLTQILIGIPIYILYELSIHLAKRIEKQKAREELES
ncbi:MAG: twin-arginine translocase subunit TatC [Saprospiraceae bacterium]